MMNASIKRSDEKAIKWKLQWNRWCSKKKQNVLELSPCVVELKGIL